MRVASRWLADGHTIQISPRGHRGWPQYEMLLRPCLWTPGGSPLLMLERVLHPYGSSARDMTLAHVGNKEAVAYALARIMLEFGYAEMGRDEQRPYPSAIHAIVELANVKRARLKATALLFGTCARRYRAAHTIADRWKGVYMNPALAMGRRQVLRDFDGLLVLDAL